MCELCVPDCSDLVAPVSQHVFLQSLQKGKEHGKLHAAFLNASTHISLSKASPLAMMNSQGSMKCNLLIGPGG